MNPYQELKLLTRGMVAGQSQGGLLCPFCQGGRTGERTLSVHLREDGVVLFICFRATCGKHGRIHNNGNVVASDNPPNAPKGFEPRWFKDETRALNKQEIETIWSLYGLTYEDIKRHRLSVGVSDERLCIPIIGVGGSIRGYELRVFGKDLGGQPKTLHFKHKDEPWIGWFVPRLGAEAGSPIVLVEDVISAMKVAHQYASVSLMGSHLGMQDLYEVAKVTDNIILALDKDATEKALALQKKYRFICPTMRVMILSKDLKYLPDGDITTMVASL